MSTILLTGSAFLLLGVIVVAIFVVLVVAEFVGLWLRSLGRPRGRTQERETEPDEL